MMTHSIERFWRWIWLVNDLVNFTKTDGWVRMRYHSNFASTPTIPDMGKGLTRNLCALVWVPSKQASSGLCRGLPLQKKWCDMTWMRWIVRPKPCAVPRLTVCLHWEAKLMGRGAYTRVCKWKVMVGSPHTECDKSGPVNPDGLLQILWHKCTTSAECRTIRIAVSTVTDDWKGHTVPSSDHFQKCGIWLVTWTWKVNGEFDLNHNRVVGMTLMFPLESV